MKNIDSYSHLRGESLYLDDIPVREGTLYGAVIDGPVAHGNIRGVDLSAVRRCPGVVRVLTAEDIPGENQIGGILPDEPLFAEDQIHFMGQPMALVVAETEAIAQEAAKLARADIEVLPAIIDPREAQAKGELIIPPRTFKLGNPDEVWTTCEHVFEGRADTGGQEHLYIEAQGAYAYPMENGAIKLHSSTQGPTSVQRTTARVLAIPMHRVEIDVTRLGGGFGGKEDQATPWAVMAALAAQALRRPVKLVLHRLDDMRMTGKRHPYSSDFKIGLSKDLRILAYQVTFYQNAGAAADLSPAVMERTLFHFTNSYFIPHVRATAYSCRTHLPPNTAFRGFGGPQGMFVIEAAIAKAAETLGIRADQIQKRNLLKDGDRFPYGQKAEGCEALNSWLQVERDFEIQAWRRRVADFNQKQSLFSKGLSFMPICFGISFTKLHMNQAGALVHVYQDGSVGISTAAVEMGQGVNTKMVQVAAGVFGISPDRIKVESTNTTRVANTSPTAASSSADLNGKALEQACETLKTRLLAVAREALGTGSEPLLDLGEERVLLAGKATELVWEKLIETAFLTRTNLTAQGFYATPGLSFDTGEEKGHPFAYHVFGTAVSEVTLDLIRGTYQVDAVRVVHDFGKTMNPIIDLGQVEGGLVQGIGWMTLEELVFNGDGRLLSGSLSTYKIPDIYSVPKIIDVAFLDTKSSPLAILKSKAVGEPPLMYGIGTYFAIRDAIRSVRPGNTMAFSAPITPEKVLMALYGGKAETEIRDHAQEAAALN